MSQLTECFTELYAAQLDSIGTSPVVAIGSVTGVPCVIGRDGNDFSFQLGGISSSGQNTIQTLTSAWTGGIPAKGDAAVVTALPGSRTITQQVLSTEELAGILLISLGDNSQ